MSNELNIVDATARQIMGALLNGLWVGITLTALVWGFQRLFRQTNAATRYLIWWATLLAVVFLPFLWLGGPVSFPGHGVESTEASARDHPVTPRSRQSLAPFVQSESYLPAPGHQTSEPVSSFQTPGGNHPNGETPDRQARSTDLSNSPVSSSYPSTVKSPYKGSTLPRMDGAVLRISPGPWAPIGLLVWLGLSLTMLMRLGWSYRHLSRLKAECQPLESHIQEPLVEWLARFGLVRSVRICQSPEVPMPLTVGLTDAVILFPERMVYSLTEAEVEQIGLHEAAHIRRWDDWTNLGQKLFEAFFFYHPAVQWISRQLNLEREVACDDWVVSVTGQPRPYAACLARLAELSGLTRRLIPAPGAILHRKHLSRRIEMLLNQSRNRTVRPSSLTFFLVVVGLVLGVFQLSHFSPIVTFMKADQSQKSTLSATSKSPQLRTEMGQTIGLAGISGDATTDPQPKVGPTTRPESADPDPGTGQTKEELATASEELNKNLRNLQREVEEKVRRGMDTEELKKQLEAHKDQIREQARRLANQAKELAGQNLQIHREEIERAIEQAQDAMTFNFFDEGDGYEFVMNPRKPEVPASEVLPKLAEIARTDSNLDVRREAIASIGRIGSDDSTGVLLQLYDSLDNKELKKEVISHLRGGKENNRKIIEKLRQIGQSSSDPELREAAIRRLSRIQDAESAGALISLYDNSKEAKTRENIIRGLGVNGSKKAIEKLMSIAKSDPDPQMRLHAVRRLGALSSGEAWNFFPGVQGDINVVVPRVVTPKIVGPKVVVPKRAPSPDSAPTPESSPAPSANP